MSRLKAYEIMKLISYLSKDYRAGVKDTERNVLPSATTASRPQRRMDLTSRVNGTGRAMCQARHVRDVRRHDLQDMILFFFFFASRTPRLRRGQWLAKDPGPVSERGTGLQGCLTPTLCAGGHPLKLESSEEASSSKAGAARRPLCAPRGALPRSAWQGSPEIFVG